MPEAWVEQFREQWAVLEVVHSLARADEQAVETPENRLLVDGMIVRIRDLIAVAS